MKNVQDVVSRIEKLCSDRNQQRNNREYIETISKSHA